MELPSWFWAINIRTIQLQAHKTADISPYWSQISIVAIYDPYKMATAAIQIPICCCSQNDLHVTHTQYTICTIHF